MGKGRAYTPKEYESSRHGGADKFAGIYMSMVDSQAWSELTANQRVLYVYFKLQIHDKYLKSEYGDLAFTFNRGKWRDKYGLYRDGNQQGFYRDRDALIEKGFVDCVKCGQRTKEKSVYRLSDRWQHYGQPTYTLPPKYMSSSLYRKAVHGGLIVQPQPFSAVEKNIQATPKSCIAKHTTLKRARRGVVWKSRLQFDGIVRRVV